MGKNVDVNRLKYKNYLLTVDNKFGSRETEKSIKYRLPEIHIEIIAYNEKWFSEYEFVWKQKLFNWLNNVESIPLCRNSDCENEVKFNKATKNYSKYCSNYCTQTSEEIINKKKKTTFENHGVEYPMQCIEIKEKTKKSYYKKYGVTNPSKNNNIQNKKIKTSIERYGVDNYSKTETFKIELKTIRTKNTEIKYAKKLNISPNNIKLIDRDLFQINNLCENHETFIISRYNLYNRLKLGFENVCTKCTPIHSLDNKSIKEIEIGSFIESLGVNIIRGDRIILNGLEIDIYLPEYRLGIEHNGIYTHSTIFKDKYYHFNKTELAEKHNIKLLHIFEDEWVLKKDIVKSLIRSKLELYDQKIFVNDCEIKEINDIALVRTFLEKNHIMGFVGGGIKLGLYYNNDLISIMIFRKKKHKINEFELLRYCSRLNIQVIGGTKRLFNYFVSKYSPKSILKLVDRRYGQGKLYEKLGFKHIGYTNPNYCYYNKHSFIKQSKLNFSNSTKTEKEIMFELGYCKAYDSGKSKFILEL